VADFIGVMNFVAATVVRDGRVRLGGVELACDADGLAPGTPVTLAIRPEDIVIQDGSSISPNALPARVDALAFLGSFFRADLVSGRADLVGGRADLSPGDAMAGVLLRADLPVDLVRRLAIAEKSALTCLLPRERIRATPGAPSIAEVATASDVGVAVVRPEPSRDDRLMRVFVGVIALYLVVALALPLGLMRGKSLQGPRDDFVGLANYARYFSTPALFQSIGNSLWVSILSTAITVPAAFVYAYALTRSRMPLRGLFKTMALVPILVPSLLPGLALVYLFGNQGLIKGLLLGHSIYGPIGIVMAEVFAAFPHALLIILAALALADARLYEAAVALRASRPRIFWTVTLPGARYGLISATFVVFTTVITDFGAPKVIGGQYNVLATDVYKQVVGQQNFQMGAVVSVMLLVPAILAFLVDRAVRRRHVALLSARAVPYEPRPQKGFDLAMLVYCAVIATAILAIVAVSQFAAVVTFFPYNLTLTWAHYDFDQKGGGGWVSYSNSIRLALATAVIGTAVVFVGAYLTEKTRGFAFGRGLLHFLAMLPMAVPGLVLGLA
jgi:iron(III) transport system permease protein